MQRLTVSVILGFSTIAFVGGCICSSPKSVDAVWIPDNGDGTYKNPVIFADYSDPDVIRVGEDFYMTASSFNCMPGLPILHSKDLVNWTLIGHAFDNYPIQEFNKPQHGKGVWAPAIRYHDGEYYIYFGDPDHGIFMTKAKDPAGPWSQLHCVKEVQGWIDPCPFWDDDGKAYLVHAVAKSRIGYNAVLFVRPMSPDGMQLLGEGARVFDGGEKHPTMEGPKMYRRNRFYYIFAPAGGVEFGWQTALRSTNIFGPYEDRIVLTQGNTEINGPHQGAWVHLESGEDWFVHFQERGAYGRLTHLQPMRWIDDWPVMGADPDSDGTGEPVLGYRKPDVGRSYPIAVPATTDEFDSKSLALQWQWYANFESDWSSLLERPGWLRLHAHPNPADGANLFNVPNLLLQKLPGPEFTVTTHLDATGLLEGEKAGLVIMGFDYAHLSVERTDDGLKLKRVICMDANSNGKEFTEAELVLPGDQVFLQVHVRPEAICRFSYSIDCESFVPIGKEFSASEGRWIGAKVGLFCISQGKPTPRGHADFEWFRFE